MLKIVRRTLLIALLVVGGAFLLYQGFLFWRALDKLPPGTTVAGVDVAGMTLDAAREAIDERYLSPIAVFRGDERAAELLPAEVGFSIDIEAMLVAARAEWEKQEMWRRYAEFVVGMSPRPINIGIIARHDDAALRRQLDTIADFVDRPAQGPQLLVDTGVIQAGQPGVVTDREASMQRLRMALYSPTARTAMLTLIDEPAPDWNIQVLQDAIENQLASFEGFGSVYVLDLQTGEEVRINSDVAVSGLSILKIAIFVEAYRTLDQPPNDYERQLFIDTATASSNHAANLLLHIIAGEENTYAGAEALTEGMHEMGMVNSFMAIPYDAQVVPSRPSTYATPANERTDVNTNPDPTMQTTAEDIGYLLGMLYYCARGEGGLLAIYPGEITQDECQAIVDLMVQNVEGNLIRYGVPETADVRVSHKHGWSFNEHGDAGIVYSPGGDYVIYTLLAQPENDWLMSEYSFPILREISRTAYNYFNPDAPYAGRPEHEQTIDAAAPDPTDGALPETVDGN
ncbi:MAG: class A beta-lactamase-related serine hydrolase [Candidatus Promineofilum sp.]|nr:class A beta-lactamase-related serine hydrolase [Promineifilum sp.]MCW5862577.1 serine hydrolase [Anaerolineae bacterium]